MLIVEPFPFGMLFQSGCAAVGRGHLTQERVSQGAGRQQCSDPHNLWGGGVQERVDMSFDWQLRDGRSVLLRDQEEI